jgi:DNA-binding NarL/FixJ family response regulator
LLVADDHPMLRRSVRQRVEIEGDIKVCGEAESIEELMGSIGEAAPDAVLMDLRMGDGDPFPVIRAIHQTWPALPILVFSIHSESLYAERSLQAGASGYLMKADAADQLIPAIRSVLAGQTYLSEAARGGVHCDHAP